jgi:hypothetical protein
VVVNAVLMLPAAHNGSRTLRGKTPKWAHHAVQSRAQYSLLDSCTIQKLTTSPTFTTTNDIPMASTYFYYGGTCHALLLK